MPKRFEYIKTTMVPEEKWITAIPEMVIDLVTSDIHPGLELKRGFYQRVREWSEEVQAYVDCPYDKPEMGKGTWKVLQKMTPEDVEKMKEKAKVIH